MDQLESRQVPSWTTSDLEGIAKALSVTVEAQKSYGKTVNLKGIMDYMRHKLEGRTTAPQVVEAIDIYTDHHDDIPTPANLLKIIFPQKKISYAEYQRAIEQRKAENYPPKEICYWHQIITQYEMQHTEKPIYSTQQRIGQNHVLKKLGS